MSSWTNLLSFERMPVRRKLTVLVTLAAGIALVLVTAAVIITNSVQMRGRVLRNLTIEARMCANNSTAALAFDDAETANEVLASLANDGDVIAAATYTAGGEILGTYIRPRSATRAVLPTTPGPTGLVRDGSTVTIVEPIDGDGETTDGWLYLQYDLTPLYVAQLQQVGIVVLAAALALAVSLLLTVQLKRGLEIPVRHLADTARQVSTDRNYAIRAVRTTHDELGELTDSFNEMLAEIQVRNAALREHQERLEDRILERTSDLEQTRETLEARNAALEEAQAQAELASRAKSDFLANMSHEIRSPMTAILGYADILHGEAATRDVPAGWRDALETIRRNGRHLLNIINDILDLSKLEAGKMTVEIVPCSPAEIADDVARLMRVRAGVKGLALAVEYEPPLPATIQTDPMRLRQILLNLIGNAVKFTETGSIRVVVRTDRHAGHDVVAFDVIDTGIGMDPEAARVLFAPFTQADASTSRRFGGTGLGLTISRHFARLLGGDIAVAAAPGAGCRFTATVIAGNLENAAMIDDPVAAVEKARTASRARPQGVTEPPAILRGARILVAEDTPDNQRLIRYYLDEKCRADLRLVENGRLAVEHAMEAMRSGRPYDVVLMDMQMPEMDGYAATRELRRRGYRGPIIALTAHAMRGDRQRCLDAGMDDYVAKPIQPRELYETMARAATAGADVRAAMDDPESGLSNLPSWPAGVEPSPRREPDETAVIDRELVLDRFRDAPEFLVEMIDLFLEQCDRMLSDLRVAVTATDHDATAAAAHALKGSIGNFAAGPAGAAAQNLENEARQGANLAPAMQRLDTEIANLRAALLELRADMEQAAESDGRS